MHIYRYLYISMYAYRYQYMCRYTHTHSLSLSLSHTQQSGDGGYNVLDSEAFDSARRQHAHALYRSRYRRVLALHDLLQRIHSEKYS